MSDPEARSMCSGSLTVQRQSDGARIKTASFPLHWEIHSSVKTFMTAALAHGDLDGLFENELANLPLASPLATASQWNEFRESQNQDDAKHLGEQALNRIGVAPFVAWIPSDNDPRWEYAKVNIGQGQTLTLGASPDGMVLVERDSYAPDWQANNTLSSVVASIEAARKKMASLQSVDENSLESLVEAGLQGPGHPYSLYDPNYETNVRFWTSADASKMADKLGLLHFQHTDANDNITHLIKTGGAWRTEAGQSLADFQAKLDWRAATPLRLVGGS